MPVSVAPRGIERPSTLELELEGWLEVDPPLDVVAQLLLDVIPPPSNVEGADDVVPLPPVEPLALQEEPTVGPRPPGLISVAPRETPAAVKPLAPLEPIVPKGEVAPIPDGAMVVCASLAAQANKSVRAAIKKRLMNISGTGIL